MAFRRTLLTILLLMILAVEAYTEEECSSPSSVSEFRNTVIDAVCSMNDTTRRAFTNQTRFNHGAGHKSDGERMYIILFQRERCRIYYQALFCLSLTVGGE